MRLDGITAERWNFIISHPEKLPQGIHLWYKGVPFPRRVYWDWMNDPNFTLRALDALGQVKKFLLSLTFITDFAIPYRINIKKYERFLLNLNAQFVWTLAEFKIKDEEFSVPVWEIGKFVRSFLENIGLNEELSISFARIAMMILELDNAYRYRAQDLVGIFNKEWFLKNPVKEIERVLKIYLTRELAKQDDPGFGARGKIMRLDAFKWALLIPKVKRAVFKALEGVDLEKIKFDDNDRYHFSFWRGYDYEGKDFNTRYQVFLDAHKGGFPPYRKREDPNLTAKFMAGDD